MRVCFVGLGFEGFGVLGFFCGFGGLGLGVGLCLVESLLGFGLERGFVLVLFSLFWFSFCCVCV